MNDSGESGHCWPATPEAPILLALLTSLATPNVGLAENAEAAAPHTAAADGDRTSRERLCAWTSDRKDISGIGTRAGRDVKQEVASDRGERGGGGLAAGNREGTKGAGGDVKGGENVFGLGYCCCCCCCVYFRLNSAADAGDSGGGKTIRNDSSTPPSSQSLSPILSSTPTSSPELLQSL